MPNDNQLQHYGVMGMKWGKHKKQDSAAVQKLKADVIEKKARVKAELKKQNKQTSYGLIAPSRTTIRDVNKATLDYKYAKEDLLGVSILEKLNSTKKSKSQLAQEEKYKKKGMTDDEAAIAAYKYNRTKKILASVGTAAVVAGGAYAGYKISDHYVDKVLKSGKTLQRIMDEREATAGIKDAFYSSGNKLDNTKYAGMYGRVLHVQGRGAYKAQIKVLSDIKQASPVNAKKALDELVQTDPKFKDSLQKYIRDTYGAYGPVYNQKQRLAQQALSTGKVDKHVYEMFNVALVDHSPEMQTLSDKYFNNLASKGYNALKDVNDSKYSGYKAINPIIAFNSKGLVDVVDIKKLAQAEIVKANSTAWNVLNASAAVKQGSLITSAILASSVGSKVITNNTSSKAVQKYITENPGTKMTNTEIARMLERSRLNVN